jgi:hypothetical protein
MADENVMNGRQIFKPYSGGCGAAHAPDRHWLAVSKDGVGEDVEPLVLDEEGGVADPGEANLSFGLG